MRLAMHKLPVKCKFVKREDIEAENAEAAAKEVAQ
jgi:ribosomal protein L16/L10AE